MYILGDDCYKLARLEKWKLVFRKLIPQMFEEKDPRTLPILIESLSTIGSDGFSELEVFIYFLSFYSTFSRIHLTKCLFL